MKCLVCGDDAEYVLNNIVPLCETCAETMEDDMDDADTIEPIDETHE